MAGAKSAVLRLRRLEEALQPRRGYVAVAPGVTHSGWWRRAQVGQPVRGKRKNAAAFGRRGISAARRMSWFCATGARPNAVRASRATSTRPGEKAVLRRQQIDVIKPKPTIQAMRRPSSMLAKASSGFVASVGFAFLN